jgi:hypothetical protein
MRSERSSTKYLWMVVFAASRQRIYSFLAFRAFSLASLYLFLRYKVWIYISFWVFVTSYTNDTDDRAKYQSHANTLPHSQYTCSHCVLSK